MKEFTEQLKQMHACSDAIEWSDGKTLREAWETCPRGDWMLWLAARLKVDHRKLTLAKGLCANTVRHLMKDERSLKAVDVAIAYGRGNATAEELYAAAASAYDAAAASAYDAYAAADAAYAAAAADAAADDAAAAATDAAADADADAAADAAAAYAADADAADADAATAAADAAYAAYAAYATAAATAAADAAYAARTKNQKQTADICRKILTDQIEKHF